MRCSGALASCTTFTLLEIMAPSRYISGPNA
ncbi:Uncharacterised protein [Bordetella pertussis]|nr:Uncharacterised protein [Bordetella pertussis]CFW29964.1 Uncharacterised protein [Bordetella pertussis]